MPRKKRDEYEEDNFLDEVNGDLDDEVEDETEDDVAEDDDSEEEESEEDEAADDSEEEEEDAQDSEDDAEEEEEIEYPPDDKKAVAALEKLNVRLDVSEKGNVWRVIFDDSNGRDPALVLLKGLPALRELWLLGTRVTEDAAKQFKEDHPKITVYY